MVFLGYRHSLGRVCAIMGIAALSFSYIPSAAANTSLSVPVNRSSLVVLPSPSKEIMVSDPDIADVHAHNPLSISVIGKSAGRTNIRVFGENGKILRTFDVTVGYDLPAIRKSLKTFLPDETIGVEMVNTSVALTGQVRNASVAQKAVKIVRDFIGGSSSKDFGQEGSAGGAQADSNPEIMNLLKITSGQQVMLRVRVGEVNRDALKRLGVDPSLVLSGSSNVFFSGALGSGISGLAVGADAAYTLADANRFRGTAAVGWQNGGSRVGAVVSALERDGLFRLLAEPNLVAVSGEEAEFLAGGEIPIAVPQSSSGGSTVPTITVEYKTYGVAVKFSPDVLSENRIRIKVQPEVSELDPVNGTELSGSKIPAITTRRAKTTVELAPGESFMIAGLLKDRSQATIDQLPGLKELPVLGALFRSTEFQRNESELVIAVTPYLVDPLKSSDVKMPSDDFRPASQVEAFFFGTLGAIAPEGKESAVEGPTGFMVD